MSKPVRWGIVGCGDIANKRVAPAINAQPDSELVAFCSRARARAQECAHRHGAPRAYDDLGKMLADADINAVYVASPVHRHHPETLAAAAAGKHVLCEKPMALTVSQGEEMISACARAGVRLAVAYYRRWYPKTRKMKELLQGGAIGKVISIHVCLMSRYDPSPDDPKYWRVEMAHAGGGALMDVGSHRLDVLCYLFGPPQSVAGFADRVEMAYEVPDNESLVARYASGAHLCGAFSWCSAERRDDMVIYGTRGALLASPFDGPTLALENEAGREEFSLPPHDNVHYPLIDSFADRLARGQPPEFDGNDGLAAARIIEACYQSARTGSVAALARSPG